MTEPASFCRKCTRAEVVPGHRCSWCGDFGGDMPRRTFHLTHECWWFQPYGLHRSWREQHIEAEIMFGLNIDGGGTMGECAMRWHRLTSDPSRLAELATPRLEVFCDAWVVLERFSDVIRTLATRDSLRTRHNMTPVEFKLILTDLGFDDRTEAEEPSGRR